MVCGLIVLSSMAPPPAEMDEKQTGRGWFTVCFTILHSNQELFGLHKLPMHFYSICLISIKKI